MLKRQYRVDLSSVAYVDGVVYVEAASEEEAEKLATGEMLGDVEWHYHGLKESDHEIAVDCVEDVDG